MSGFFNRPPLITNANTSLISRMSPYGSEPHVIISYSNTPKLHTSLMLVNTRFSRHSGALHLTGKPDSIASYMYCSLLCTFLLKPNPSIGMRRDSKEKVGEDRHTEVRDFCSNIASYRLAFPFKNQHISCRQITMYYRSRCDSVGSGVGVVQVVDQGCGVDLYAIPMFLPARYCMPVAQSIILNIDCQQHIIQRQLTLHTWIRALAF